MAPSEGFDPEKAKDAAAAELEAVQQLFSGDDPEYGQLDKLWEALQNDEVGKKALVITVAGKRLRLDRRDKPEVAYEKVDEFLRAIKAEKGKGDEAVAGTVKDGVNVVATSAEGAVEALVPEVGKLRWRDVNAEIELLANNAKGTPDEGKLREIRKFSHKGQLGKSDYNVVVFGVSLQLWADDSDDETLLKLVRFVKTVKSNSPILTTGVSSRPKPKKEGIDPLYWRDIIAGIDGLLKTYPDEDYSSLVKLRDLLEKGEIGSDDRLLLNIGPVFLNILAGDDEETMLEKFAVFIGELKQVADIAKKGDEESIDPELEKTYWRDILGALEELEEGYGNNQQFKLLKLSIEKGILGTVKDFKATIDGITLDIRQSDTDVEMRDKLSRFVRELNKGGMVKIREGVREKYEKLEKDHRQLAEEKRDLQSRYEDMTSDMRKKDTQIRRMQDDNAAYQEEIRRLQAELSTRTTRPAPATVRPWSG